MATQDFTFNALGTVWAIETQPMLSTSQKNKLLKSIREFEQAYSRFNPSSLLSRLNDTKKLVNPPQEMLNMLHFALDMYQKTDGIFNISVGAVLENNGYGRHTLSPSALSTDLTKDITISPKQIIITDSLRLDFGGFGKGWLIDKLASELQTMHIQSAVINGGGDIFTLGTPSTLYIEHPLNPKLAIGEVTAQNCGFCSSSPIKRVWQNQVGKNVTHIQPTTQHSSDELLSVHVLAPTALLSDTLATVFLLTDHTQRIELAHTFNVEFLEVRQDQSYWRSSDFPLTPYT